MLNSKVSQNDLTKLFGSEMTTHALVVALIQCTDKTLDLKKPQNNNPRIQAKLAELSL